MLLGGRGALRVGGVAGVRIPDCAEQASSGAWRAVSPTESPNPPSAAKSAKAHVLGHSDPCAAPQRRGARVIVNGYTARVRGRRLSARVRLSPGVNRIRVSATKAGFGSARTALRVKRKRRASPPRTQSPPLPPAQGAGSKPSPAMAEPNAWPQYPCENEECGYPNHNIDQIPEVPGNQGE